jgi:Delta6-protoilludene synthase
LAASLRGSKSPSLAITKRDISKSHERTNKNTNNHPPPPSKRFWQRIPSNATATFRRRFLGTWLDYVESVARQAEHRRAGHIMDLASYFPLRRHTSGAPSTIALYEMDLDIPDEVRAHPALRELEELAVDLIVIANDVLSYNKEQAAGDDAHNLVTILMAERRLGVQAAVDEAGRLARARVERFRDAYARLPRLVGPVDLDVQRLADGMAQCVSGVMHWSYESERYFGTRGLDVKESRVARLLPKVSGAEAMGPVPVDDSKI